MIKIKTHTRCKFKFAYRQLSAGLIVATLFFTAGCLSDQGPGAAGGSDNNEIVNGKDVETVTDEMRARSEGIPLIDGQIPEELETATLAMG